MSAQGSKDTSSSIWVAVEAIPLPDKKYFKIGEVAQLVGVEPHVLRYWQTQFPQVRPQKSRSGHRLYRRKDVETLLAVRELLHVQRFTIAGARQALRSLVRTDKETLRPSSADGDGERRPERPAPRVDVEQLDIEGLESDELHAAMARQLAERSGTELAEVDVEAEREDSALAARVAEAVAAEAPRVEAAAATVDVAGRTAVLTDVDVAPRNGSSARARGREQLGFGFRAPDRASLEAARAEVRAILEHLDREDAHGRRLRSGS